MKLTANKFPFLEDYRLPHGYNIVKRKRKLNDENFHIVTLGDKVVLGDNIFTTVLGTGLDFIISLIGGGRKRLTNEDWLRIIPGSGYWTNKYRNWLANRISYDVDLRYLREFPNDSYFVHENLAEISQGKYPNLYTGEWQGSDNWQKFMNYFWQQLAKEQKTSGNTGNYSGSESGLNLFSNTSSTQNIILIGAAIGLLFAMMNKKK